MSDDLIMKSKEGIKTSAVFLALGTKSYANSIRDPRDDDHYLIISQIEYAKALGKPAVILLDRDLSAEDKRVIKEALEGMDLIGVFGFEARNEASIDAALASMRKAFEAHLREGK